MFREATLALALICSPASRGGMCTIPEDVYLTRAPLTTT